MADGSPDAAIVCTAWVAVRAEPSHRAEMVSQWLCGETLTILETGSGWARCRGAEYEGWTPLAPLRHVDRASADAWSAAATARSLGAILHPVPDGRDPARSSRESAVPSALPWGARVRARNDGSIELPDGRFARPEPPAAVVTESERETRFAREGGAVVDTALGWLGVPYLWGGRTEAGVDCSGLVQSVFDLHGIELPRDSDQQWEVGVESRVDSSGRAPGDLILFAPGDLIFFAPEDRGVTHIAICAGGDRILHAAASNGQVTLNDLNGGERLERALGGSIVGVTRPVSRG